MKRFLAIALLFSYSIASFGLSISLDYCCGELEGISIGASQPINKSSASQNPEKVGIFSEDDGCCAQSHLTIQKIKDSQIASQHLSVKVVVTQPMAVLPQAYQYTLNCLPKNYCTQKAFFLEPPPPWRQARQALLCVFRI